jgi:hypothetical protein
MQTAQNNMSSLASPMSPNEEALASLVSAFGAIPLGCFTLHGNGQLSDDQRSGFYRLGNDALNVQQRIDPLWVRIVQSTRITVVDINANAAACNDAATALDAANNNPTNSTLVDAYAKASSVIDLVDALLDHA